MLFLCLVRKGVGSLPHELGLHIASFLPHICTYDKEYKRLYQAFLEDGYILGPLLRITCVPTSSFNLIGGDLKVSAVGKITKVNVVSYYEYTPLSFSACKELLTLDTLKDRSNTFTHEGYTHKEWIKGYKSYELHLKGFREARIIEQDKNKRQLRELLEKKETMPTKSKKKLLEKIQALEKDLLALETKLQNITLYL